MLVESDFVVFIPLRCTDSSCEEQVDEQQNPTCLMQSAHWRHVEILGGRYIGVHFPEATNAQNHYWMRGFLGGFSVQQRVANPIVGGTKFLLLKAVCLMGNVSKNYFLDLVQSAYSSQPDTLTITCGLFSAECLLLARSRATCSLRRACFSCDYVLPALS